MDIFSIISTAFKGINEASEFISANFDSVDKHHFLQLKGQLYTLEGYINNLKEETMQLKTDNIRDKQLISDLKIENNVLRKLIKESQE